MKEWGAKLGRKAAMQLYTPYSNLNASGYRMGKGSPSAPAAPDPAATSAAQTQSNKETALYNFGLNNPNVTSPLGSQTFTQTGGGPQYNTDAYSQALDAYYKGLNNPSNGGQTYVDTNGITHYAGSGQSQTSAPTLDQFKIGDRAPQVTQDIKLSPEQQQLYDQQTQQSIGLSNLASQLQGRVGDTLNQAGPSEADINALQQKAQDAYYQQQTQYLDPQFANQQKQLDAGLANQGLTMGSEAYNNAQNQQALQKQQAYSNAQNQAITQGTQNAQQLFSLNSAERNQPLNEFNALRSGSQVQMPTFSGVNQSQAAPTNVSGNINQGYQNQLGLYNAQTGQQNSALGGLFSLGGNLGSSYLMSSALAAASDRRLKTSIRFLGKTEKDIAFYTYKYIGSDALEFGVMADEVAHIPDAVIRGSHGFDVVDYARVM